MIQASIIICTRNPRPQYLCRTLAALQNQTVAYDQWELLLVDNASEEDISRWDISWQPNARHIRERKIGLAVARRRGISEALADLLIFVDDDNVLAADYISEALRIKKEWPSLGTWGSGTIVPEFERPPARHLTPYLSRLALRNNKQVYWSNVLSCSDATPVGAGMCVRAIVANEYRRIQTQQTIQITGRTGTKLVGHEDYEIAFVGCTLGFGMGVFPELRMTHLIPKERLSDEYFIRHAEGNELSSGLMAYKWLGQTPENPFSSKGLLSIIKNVVLTGGFHRWHHLAIVKGRTAARRALARYDSASVTSQPQGDTGGARSRDRG
jgi:glycosyltransferase involved in cell wall biosynthesis